MDALPTALRRSALPLGSASLALPLLAPPTLAQVTPPAVPIYTERALELGLEHETLTNFDEMGTGISAVLDWAQSGVAFGDVDGDQWVDLVACGSLMPNHLWLNPGPQPAAGEPLRWIDVSEAAGIRSGWLDRAPAFGDHDRDGDLDLFIGTLFGGATGPVAAHSRLYENDGNGVFTDVTARAGTYGNGRTLFAQWFDLDLDGWLDLYTSEFHLTPNHLYRNNGDGSFLEIAVAAGAADAGSAHATGIADFDEDGDPDVLVGNDHGVGLLAQVGPNLGDAFFVNDGTGTFTNEAVSAGLYLERGIMGVAVGDVDYDSHPDIYRTDLGRNWLHVDQGYPESGVPYSDATQFFGVMNEFVPHLDTGIPGKTSGWAAFFLDADHDSWDDLFVVNGQVPLSNPLFSVIPRHQQNFMFQGLGPAGAFKFADRTEEFGILDNYDDRAGAYADVDRDGDLDIVVVETAGVLRFFESRLDQLAGTQLPAGGYLEARLSAGTSAPEGVGARLRFTDGEGWVRSRWIGSDGPTASQNERIAHFGLGDIAALDLEVLFPSGIELALPGVSAGEQLAVAEPELFQLSSTNLPAAAFAGPGDATSVVVTAFAHDASGGPLGSGASVSIDVPGLDALGPVDDAGDGSYRRSFSTAAAPGAYRVEVDFAGFQPLVRPCIHLVGPVDPQRSRVAVAPEALRAGSDEEFTVHVTPCDSDGVLLGGGHSVDVQAGSTSVVAATDLGDGVYRATLPAPPTPDSASLSVAVDGVPLATSPVLEAAGPVSGDETFVQVNPARPFHNASPHQIKIRVVPRDDGGRRLGTQALVELVPQSVVVPPSAITQPDPFLSHDNPSTGSAGGGGSAGPAGTAAIGGERAGALPGVSVAPLTLGPMTVVEGLDPTPRADGAYLFALEIAPWAFDVFTHLPLEIWIDGQLAKAGQVPIVF